MHTEHMNLRRTISKYVPDPVKRVKRNFVVKLRSRRYRNRYHPPFDNTFSGISIETRTDCNLKCTFCPQSTNPRKKLVMTEDMFRRIIDNLAEMHFAGRICPLTNNEPLLDERMVDFISYARQRCPLAFLELITNGRLLTEELLGRLFAAGLDNLVINDYRRRTEEDPNRLNENLRRISELSDGMFRNKITIALRSTGETLGTRAGNIDRGRTRILPLKQFCALPLTRMWIQPEGKAILCCEDYGYDEVMGDASENSLSEIWNSDKYKRIRRELHAGDRTGKICEKCEYSGFPLPGEKTR